MNLVLGGTHGQSIHCDDRSGGDRRLVRWECEPSVQLLRLGHHFAERGAVPPVRRPSVGRQGHCPGYEVVMFGSDLCRPGEFGVTQCESMSLLIGSRQRCGFSPIPAAMAACQAARQAARDACENQSEYCEALERAAVLLCAPCRVNTCAPVGYVQPLFGQVRVSHSGVPCPFPFEMVPPFQEEQLTLPFLR